jgi:hypothetical protein
MSRKLLVIGNSNEDMISARELFKGAEYRLLFSADYDDALATMHKERPEIVLTDIFLQTYTVERELFPAWIDVEERMLVGYVLAINAVISGAGFVGVVTDESHHRSREGAILDRLRLFDFTIRSSFTNRGALNFPTDLDKAAEEKEINVAKLGFYPIPSTYARSGIVCEKCNGATEEGGRRVFCRDCNSSGIAHGEGKDWLYALKRLLGDVPGKRRQKE